jgi:catechol 2,3-dioxygenase
MAEAAQSSSPAIDPRTAIGTVRLTVTDLDQSRQFYEQVLGLPADSELLELHGDRTAAPLDRRATGLYHFAILVPTRVDLAQSLMRIAAAHWPLDGASDHLVSEALYLSDPDGNGIEIYRDRPREEWPVRDGQLQMATIPLDLDGLLNEAPTGGDPQPTLPTGARVGHVHLQVADLDDAERFYSGLLGFDVTVRGYPGALFISAGGYHHHIGLNTWNSAGGSPPAPGSVGLRSFEVRLPDAHSLQEEIARLRDAGLELERGGDGALVHDPSGNGVLLTAA